MIFVLSLVCTGPVRAAPYAAMVMDARSGEVLHSRNADTPLHPASLTKMMTLYVVFEAVKRGELTMDTKIKISKKAAAEPPSKLGLRAGSRIDLRYLVRAAAVKSANDAATALGEAVSGSEAAFARRMNRTAKALGMSRTNFKNAHGLTESGHMSTARDMTMLGRSLFYDYPQYYNLFSRRSTDAGIRKVNNTNRRLLAAYRGADGIKTGYTRAAGFNLVASAERGSKRIIATVFGGRSTATRNARVAELLDMGFGRAPGGVPVNKPTPPVYVANVPQTPGQVAGAKGKTVRPLNAVAVKTSPRPLYRPVQNPAGVPLIAGAPTPVDALLATLDEDVLTTDPAPVAPAKAPEQPVAAPARTLTTVTAPLPRPADLTTTTTPAQPKVVTRMSTAGGRHFGINIGRYPSKYEAERVLLKTALAEIGTLDEALRKVVTRNNGFDANFVGMTAEMAELACQRLSAKNLTCAPLNAGG